MQKAQLEGLDLVEVSPNARPPVAKIIDWGKFKYQKTKEAQKSRKKSKSPDLKQLRFGLKIGQHDMDVKVRKAKVFLEEGHKVKLTAVYRGREMAHKELGFKLLERVMEQLGEIAIVDQEPQLAGKHLNMTIRRSNAKVKDS